MTHKNTIPKEIANFLLNNIKTFGTIHVARGDATHPSTPIGNSFLGSNILIVDDFTIVIDNQTSPKSMFIAIGPNSEKLTIHREISAWFPLLYRGRFIKDLELGYDG